MRGLIVGRFQPLHLGHVAVIREVLAKCDDLVIVIGSAEESHTEKNPFTAGERYQMIISSLTPEQRARVHIIPLRDVNRYSIWVNHVESYVPPFDIVFSNSGLTRSLFRHAGYEVSRTKAYNPKVYSATNIRKRIISGQKWRHLVPKEVASMLEGLDARSRLLDSGMGTEGKRRGCRAR
ncbi:MAG: nicotinamide-nucleotide adenylyltransferase [Candidatus Thermoplasmatota archaeon]|nr:nicotinamide-nucleotide adenylyltransferase [Candidatus Thermoplasmatota archaeon]